MNRSLPLMVLLVASGCASEYAYVPTTNAVATVHGNIAADYPIPANAPRGDVRIASYGLTDVHPRNAPNETLRALHLRAVLADNGAAPWTLDTREQRVDLDGGDELPPAFASANRGTPPPEVTVEPNHKRIVDLFFLLPANLQHADAVPSFDAVWRLHTPEGVIAERTPFARLAIEPDADGYYDDWDYGDDYYWGGPYWVNDAYPYLGFPFGHAYFGAGVVIHRAPHFWPGYVGGSYRGGRGGGFHGGRR
jgi:hypothetical protein